MKYDIPMPLMSKYVHTILAMQCGIMTGNHCMVAAMETKRSLLHAEILSYANTSRDDDEFSMWLARLTEDLIESHKEMERELAEELVCKRCG